LLPEPEVVRLLAVLRLTERALTGWQESRLLARVSDIADERLAHVGQQARQDSVDGGPEA
jgi:hypothetical protein